MNNPNPYVAPGSELSELTDETYEPKVFSVNGRIGRLRYLAYSYGIIFLSTLVLGVLAAVMVPIMGREGPGSVIVMIVGLAFYVFIIAVGFIMAKRRLNDLDKTGWLSLLMLVPFVNFIMALYLVFAPGSPTSNNYGPRPSENTKLVIFGGLIVPVGIVVIGILAAISIPAYQDYVKRAKAAEIQQQSQQESPAQQKDD